MRYGDTGSASKQRLCAHGLLCRTIPCVLNVFRKSHARNEYTYGMSDKAESKILGTYFFFFFSRKKKWGKDCLRASESIVGIAKLRTSQSVN